MNEPEETKEDSEYLMMLSELFTKMAPRIARRVANLWNVAIYKIITDKEKFPDPKDIVFGPPLV